MRWHFMLLLAALVAIPHQVRAQNADDTLPASVVDQAYDAILRCDRVAFYSLFAHVWYYSTLEDSSQVVTLRSRDKAILQLDPNSAWARCGDKPKASQGRYNILQRIVLGPYVVDKHANEAGSYVHLDIFEVRHGLIVREWESGNYSSWTSAPSRK
jgi:hypothetical protein